MTNKEKYKQAFSVLHTSEEFSVEVDQVKSFNKRKNIRRIVAAVITCLLLVGVSGTVYAANVGGIQRKIQLWIDGDKTDVVIEFSTDVTLDNNGVGSYIIKYEDEDGELQEQGGGGIAIEVDGSERPLTEEELMEHLNQPEVSYNDDGTVWVYYYDQKINITDKFDKDICYVKLSNGNETLYMTIKYKDGWSTSPDKYVNP